MLNEIRGQNLFDRHSVNHMDPGTGKRLKGRSCVSMQQLDDKVDTMLEEPSWMADFQAMRKRREG
ncbi:MAG: hypothetical protein DRI69_01805 [Bacteroidetes bacterium]|nr:MAG: hypothetical protein DRI69_01805 [Bacteroidota bacterium]